MNLAQNIPPPSLPIISSDGSMSPQWFRFFLTLWTRTGSAEGVDLDDIQALSLLNPGNAEIDHADVGGMESFFYTGRPEAARLDALRADVESLKSLVAYLSQVLGTYLSKTEERNALAALSASISSRYAPLANPTFTGTATFAGNSAYAIYASGGFLNVQFAAGSVIYFDSAAGKYYFVVGGVPVASIDGSGNARFRGTVTPNVTP
jgi:hypothetical protein